MEKWKESIMKKIEREKMIRKEIKVKKGTFNKNGILILSERKPQNVVNVQWNEKINEHTQTLSQKEKGKR